MKWESGLDVVSAEDADLNNNYIYSIDPILPAKDDAISYLFDNGPEVQAKAKVGLYAKSVFKVYQWQPNLLFIGLEPVPIKLVLSCPNPSYFYNELINWCNVYSKLIIVSPTLKPTLI